MKHLIIPLPLLFIILFGCTEQKPSDKPENQRDLVRLTYNNPGLVTDLGVGLWAWPLPMDYDEDGDYDLLVNCRDKPFNGLYFFENKSGDAFPVFSPPVRIGDPPKDIQISYVDGEPRVLVPGIEYVDFKKNLTAKPKEIYPKDTFETLNKRIRFRQWKYVDYENDGDLDIVVGIQDGEDYGWDNAYNSEGVWTNGPLHGFVYLIENIDGQYKFQGKIMAGGRPIDVYGSPSPNFDDFDGDGDLDIICGEFVDKFTWFENTGTREKPVYAAGRYLENENGVITMDLEMIIPVSLDWDKDGDPDLIVGDEDGRVAFIENTGEIHENMPVFASPRYFQQEAQYVKFGALVSPFSTDWDDDGDEDLICGNSAGYFAFIENLDGGDPPKWARPVLLENDGKPIRIMAGYNGSIQGPCEAKWGYTVQSVADWNGDGLKDIIANSIWGLVVWYENTGTKGHPALAEAKPVKVKWNGKPPKPEWRWWDPEPNTLSTQWRTTPVAIDWNGDGLTDLVMLDHEGYLSYFERFESDEGQMLKPGQRIFYGDKTYNRKNEAVDSVGGPLRLNEGKFGASGRRKIAFADWDGDGDLDLLVNSINMAWFENTGTKDGNVYFTFRGNLSDRRLAGHSTCPTIVNWDKQGKPDLLIGAEDGHFYYMRNR